MAVHRASGAKDLKYMRKLLVEARQAHIPHRSCVLLPKALIVFPHLEGVLAYSDCKAF